MKYSWILYFHFTQEVGQSFGPFLSQEGLNEKELCFSLSYCERQDEKVCGRER